MVQSSGFAQDRNQTTQSANGLQAQPCKFKVMLKLSIHGSQVLNLVLQILENLANSEESGVEIDQVLNLFSLRREVINSSCNSSAQLANYYRFDLN